MTTQTTSIETTFAELQARIEADAERAKQKAAKEAADKQRRERDEDEANANRTTQWLRGHGINDEAISGRCVRAGGMWFSRDWEPGNERNGFDGGWVITVDVADDLFSPPDIKRHSTVTRRQHWNDDYQAAQLWDMILEATDRFNNQSVEDEFDVPANDDPIASVEETVAQGDPPAIGIGIDIEESADDYAQSIANWVGTQLEKGYLPVVMLPNMIIMARKNLTQWRNLGAETFNDTY